MKIDLDAVIGQRDASLDHQSNSSLGEITFGVHSQKGVRTETGRFEDKREARIERQREEDEQHRAREDSFRMYGEGEKGTFFCRKSAERRRQFALVMQGEHGGRYPNTRNSKH